MIDGESFSVKRCSNLFLRQVDAGVIGRVGGLQCFVSRGHCLRACSAARSGSTRAGASGVVNCGRRGETETAFERRGREGLLRGEG
ncbi:hypothetical protein HBH98_048370 [Parastagonospora nodorum]|nr:hypothetical protein HBI03_120400 [Parastagonospora nodorum]KAH4281386.1 hypothetical protein HBI04_037770 [Parastagonospora nodorum]KAH4350386.1 hypothetical protein HBH98_048370 [Parastagonospora nodorum]KAH4380237.1 hypothetical protein HBH97_093490 [Parastagonospora nodorum]KAH4424653.1 hypothetical protein HBH99_035960 [Parastagonospora nodorum]